MKIAQGEKNFRLGKSKGKATEAGCVCGQQTYKEVGVTGER